MSRKRNIHYPQLESFMKEFADEYDVTYQRYGAYHMRLLGPFTVLDVWTTGKYYVLKTDYDKMAPGIIERGGERGLAPTKKKPFHGFLHKLYLPMDYL